ncbi:hypothetical protein ABGB18_39890 [Nonomuraea sp. B12E4]|uniref:hypothetical protein n=1 Tax=Nonomuraea sp. B12E4 TaxID=3153564 RepID=UPI00325D91D1
MEPTVVAGNPTEEELAAIRAALRVLMCRERTGTTVTWRPTGYRPPLSWTVQPREKRTWTPNLSPLLTRS